MNLSKMRAALSFLVMLTGCVERFDAGGDVRGEAIDEALGAIKEENALNFNALNFNALNFNALNFNALNFNALGPQDLAALQDPGATGDLARHLVRYLVSCALSSGQSFQLQWTDAQGNPHQESYPGQLGLAPGWSTGPLDLDGQELVSACLAARTNYYQVPVMISVRSPRQPLRSMTTESERDAYPEVEGAFWGNLFASPPFINACHRTSTASNSRSWQRYCAAGHVNAAGQTEECGLIHIVGPCSQVCSSFDTDGGYYPSCLQQPGTSMTGTSNVITTALPYHGNGEGGSEPSDDEDD